MEELPSVLQQYIHLSRYSRWIEELGRRETWPETVDRLISFWRNRLGDPSYEEVLEDLRSAIMHLEVMPSMRSMMTAGAALERCNVSGYNCAYMPIEHVRCFDELMYILLCGTGVGFSVERQYVNKLPEVSDEFHDTDTTIIVADSKIGWASSFRELLSLLYAGKVPKWDISRVREAGERLKTFGGRASGPEPLVDLFNFTIRLLQKAAGRKLSSIECHDLVCKIADIVVVGGVRRSALISLSNLSDDRMRAAKSGQWWLDNPQRALANNSYVADKDVSFEVFLDEWMSLYQSKSGERGIFSREACVKKAEESGKRDTDYEFGTNPCCFSGEMKLLTAGGYKRFEDLEGTSVEIVNSDGNITVGKVWCSGEKDVVSVNFNSRLSKDSIICTPDHIFMLDDGSECEALYLQGKRIKPYYTIKSNFINTDDVLGGYMVGDGALNRLNSRSHKGLEVYFGKNDGDVAEMFGQKADTIWYSREARLVAKKMNLPPFPLGYRGLPSTSPEFLTGLFSANGTVIESANRISLKSIDRLQVDKLKEALKKWDIDSYITTNKAHKVIFSNGEYECKQSYDLNIANLKSLINFAEHISFVHKYKREKLERAILAKSPYVESVKDAGSEPVYDFTEPETHWGVVEGVVAHNSEIILRPYQFCNLTELVVRQDDTVDNLKRKAKIAAILGTLQSSLTDFRYLRKKWKDNCEEERLLGVSLTGICDHPTTSNSNDGMAYDQLGIELPDLLEELREVVVETNTEWADKLGINQSTATTCVKPSGTVSQLVDSSSGIHPRFSEYYIRRVRSDKKDPLTQFLIDSGIPSEEDRTNPQTVVFSFPVKSPEGAAIAGEMTAENQLDLWKIYAKHWCEHKPSMTCYYTDNEFLEVGQWVWDNFDDISGISFMPYTDHVYPQAPYEPISEEKYEELVATMPEEIDWTKLEEYENEDNTTGSQELACKGGSCEI